MCLHAKECVCFQTNSKDGPEYKGMGPVTVTVSFSDSVTFAVTVTVNLFGSQFFFQQKRRRNHPCRTWTMYSYRRQRMCCGVLSECFRDHSTHNEKGKNSLYMDHGQLSNATYRGMLSECAAAASRIRRDSASHNVTPSTRACGSK
jgi:hypothetical protein